LYCPCSPVYPLLWYLPAVKRGQRPVWEQPANTTSIYRKEKRGAGEASLDAEPATSDPKNFAVALPTVLLREKSILRTRPPAPPTPSRPALGVLSEDAVRAGSEEGVERGTYASAFTRVPLGVRAGYTPVVPIFPFRIFLFEGGGVPNPISTIIRMAR